MHQEDEMSKKYNITVNGTTYSVEVEEVGGAPVVTAAAPVVAPAPAPVAQAEPAAAPAPAPVASAAAFLVTAPMPGTILEIKVSPGQEVKQGAVLLVLEAMKMGNDIVAPQAGIVDAILIEKGANVNVGDGLISRK